MTTTTTPPKVDRPEARYIYFQRPRCPDCGSVKLLAYRSTDNGDGSVTRYVRCADCGARFVLVVE